MATPINRIEKEFYLKVLGDEKIPVRYLKNRTEYILSLVNPVKTELTFRPGKPVQGLHTGEKMNLSFNYRGIVISFPTQVISVKPDYFTTSIPQSLYKNLDRTYLRVSPPEDFQVQYLFLGERYTLSYPKMSEFEWEKTGGEAFTAVALQELSGLTSQLSGILKKITSGYQIVLFKDKSPESMEELVITETGRMLFLPSSQGKWPQEDPFPRARIITEERFRRYLEVSGVGPMYLDEAVTRFINNKSNAGILSDAWVPLLFYEYVIGYIHAWQNKDAKIPFGNELINTLYQFVNVLVNSFKLKGDFAAGKIKNEPFPATVGDISASGMLFTLPRSQLALALQPGSLLAVKLIMPRRAINTNIKVVRRYKSNAALYFGCRFLEMNPEDIRFLFECIYGKPFTDSDASFLQGHV